MNEAQFRELIEIVYSEVRSPLTSIVATAELLRHPELGTLTVPQAELVQTMQQHGSHCFRLVHDIYQIMHLRTGENALSCRDLNLKDHLDRALEQGAPGAHEAAMTLTVQHMDPTVALYADATYLDLMLYHLVVDLGSVPKTPVIIQTTVDNGMVGIEVQAGYAVPGQTHLWPRPLVAWIVESVVAAHQGVMRGGLNRSFSVQFPARIPSGGA